MRKEKERDSMLSSENISSTNEVSIHPLFMLSSALSQARKSSKTSRGNGISVRPISQICSRSSLSTPSPSTTTTHVINDSMSSTAATTASLTPIVKMETREDEEEMICDGGDSNERSNYHYEGAGNFNYVGDFISAELNKLPLRHAFLLKNNLIREVLGYSEKLMLEAVANLKNNQ